MKINPDGTIAALNLGNATDRFLYCRWLQQRQSKRRQRKLQTHELKSNTADLRTGVHERQSVSTHMEVSMSVKAYIPQPYDEPLRKLRAANGTDSSNDSARLRDMVVFRSRLLVSAAASRWAAERPATGAVYTLPPNSYDEALKAKRTT